MTDPDYADDLAFLSYTPAQVESLFKAWSMQLEALDCTRTQIKHVV